MFRSTLKLLLFGLTVMVPAIALMCNHKAFLSKPSNDSAWIRDHLRKQPNERLADFDKRVALFTTPLKKIGFRGWHHVRSNVIMTGKVVHSAHSSDHFFTIDLKIITLSIEGNLIWTFREGKRFMRIEFETPQELRKSTTRYDLAKRILLSAEGKLLKVKGDLKWDSDNHGWLEVHTYNFPVISEGNSKFQDRRY